MKSIKLVLLILFSLASTFFSLSQDNSLSFSFENGGDFYPIGHNGANYGLLCQDKTGYYLVKKDNFALNGVLTTNREILLAKFDNDLNFILEKELNISSYKLDNVFDQIVAINDNIYVFYTKRINKKTGIQVCAQSINKSNFTLNNDEKVISNVDVKELNLGRRVGVNVRVKKRKNQLLVYYSFSLGRTKNDRVCLVELDDELKELWSQKQEKKKVNEIKSFLINEYDRNLFFLETKTVRDKKGKYLKSERYITQLDKKGILKMTKLELDMISFDFSLYNDSELILSGCYRHAEKSDSVGCFLIVYDCIKGEIKLNMEHGINEQTKEINLNKEQYPVFSTYKTPVMPYSDGYILIFEEIYRHISYSQDGMNLSNVCTFGSLMAIHVDSNGEVVWEKLIPKLQKTSEKRYAEGSFSFNTVGNKVHILFNDDSENIDQNGKTINAFNGHERELVIVTIDQKGTVQKEFIELGKRAPFMHTQKTMKFDNKFLIPFKKGSGYSFKLLSIN